MHTDTNQLTAILAIKSVHIIIAKYMRSTQ